MRLPRNSSRCAGGYHQSRLSGQVSGGGRQVSFNRKSMSLLAMKYAIGGIFFLGVWGWNELTPGHLYASYHSRKPQQC
jgi:hypothetical protein